MPVGISNRKTAASMTVPTMMSWNGSSPATRSRYNVVIENASVIADDVTTLSTMYTRLASTPIRQLSQPCQA